MIPWAFGAIWLEVVHGPQQAPPAARQRAHRVVALLTITKKGLLDEESPETENKKSEYLKALGDLAEQVPEWGTSQVT